MRVLDSCRVFDASRTVGPLACLAALLAAGPGEPFDFKESDQVAALVSGEVNETKGELYLTVEAGPVAVKRVRVYSEPSHTPLAFAASLAYSESSEGKDWQAGWGDGPQAFFEFENLTTGSFEIQTSRPDADTGIQVWILGTWPDGKEEDRLASDAEVGSNKEFSFATACSAGDGDALVLTHYCSDKEYGELALTCPGAKFACTPAPACAEEI